MSAMTSAAGVSAVLGVDTGGTFTDFVLADGAGWRVLKVPSDPEHPERAILEGIDRLGLDRLAPLVIVHGSTVATNALLEGQGARTAWVTNAGFEDVLAIGRQTRSALYDLTPAPPPARFDPALSLGVAARVGANGSVVKALDEAEVARLTARLENLEVEAAAVCLLFAYLSPEHERMLKAALGEALPAAFVSVSHEVVAEQGEYERGAATWCNAYLGPRVGGYLTRLKRELPNARLSIMQSAGVTAEIDQAALQPVRMLLSGPAGGMIGARALAAGSGRTRLLTFDMGGTSTDVGLVDGDFEVTSGGTVGGIPLAVPSVDMHTIGAGGGSIVYLDEAGGLQVGPRSAGAVPGPICYGRGGSRPTVTDANLVLGRIPRDAPLGGIVLEAEPAVAAFADLAARLALSGPEAAARAAIELVDANMVGALRVMSVQRGVDPRDLTLTSFGGAGGLHVCALADALEMREALVPANAGALSALGMVVAAPGREVSLTVITPLDAGHVAAIERQAERLAQAERRVLEAQGHAPETLAESIRLELRYRGQAGTIAVPWRGLADTEAAFHAAHTERFGHAFDRPVEVATIRVRVTAPPAFGEALPEAGTAADDARPASGSATSAGVGRETDTGSGAGLPVYVRRGMPPEAALAGPLIVADDDGTTFVAEGWQVQRDGAGNLVLARRA